jgi:hypothetical protein
MTYYKIIKDGLIIDVNYKFFRYQQKHMNIIRSDEKYAELVQTSDGSTFYRAEWLRPLPKNVHHDVAEVVIINEQEYVDLKQQLAINKEIVVENQPSIDENIPLVVDEPIVTPVLTINQLFEHIKQLEEKIRILEKK